jgi:hypothetical protein
MAGFRGLVSIATCRGAAVALYRRWMVELPNHAANSPAAEATRKLNNRI